MNRVVTKERTINWLEQRLISLESGFLIDDNDEERFENIQEFLGKLQYSLVTPVIYYKAFSGETAMDFINTLKVEISSKFSNSLLNYYSPLKMVVRESLLRMVIIDQSNIYPQNTLDTIVEKLENQNISLILAGTSKQMRDAKVLNRPRFTAWCRIDFSQDHYSLPA